MLASHLASRIPRLVSSVFLPKRSLAPRNLPSNTSHQPMVAAVPTHQADCAPRNRSPRLPHACKSPWCARLHDLATPGWSADRCRPPANGLQTNAAARESSPSWRFLPPPPPAAPLLHTHREANDAAESPLTLDPLTIGQPEISRTIPTAPRTATFSAPALLEDWQFLGERRRPARCVRHPAAHSSARAYYH